MTSVVLTLSVAAACHKAPAGMQSTPVPDQHFSILLERSASGWAAHCDVGCRWTDLSFACANDCQWRLDAEGVRNYDVERSTSDFAFVLSREHNGWSARGVRGVRWVDVKWGCDVARCRSRVDETGVRGA